MRKTAYKEKKNHSKEDQKAIIADKGWLEMDAFLMHGSTK